MDQRINYGKIAPEEIRPLSGREAYLRSSGLEARLLNLIKTRASQLNGCAYCIDMHTKDARAGGETEQRLYALAAWRETPFYSDRERVAGGMTGTPGGPPASGREWSQELAATKRTARPSGRSLACVRDVEGAKQSR